MCQRRDAQLVDQQPPQRRLPRVIGQRSPGAVDVVAVGDERNWASPPFALTEREGAYYGRGIEDDKGPVIMCLYGLRAVRELGLALRKRIRLIGSTLRSRTDEMKSEILHSLQKTLWPVFEAGRIRPVICEAFPLRDAEKAHRVLEERRNIGKVVLNVAQTI